MTMQKFISQNRKGIKRKIYSKCPNAWIEDDDEEIEQWILSDDELTDWATKEGVLF